MSVHDTTHRILKQRASIILDHARYMKTNANLDTLDEVDLRHTAELAGMIAQEAQLVHQQVSVALRAMQPAEPKAPRESASGVPA